MSAPLDVPAWRLAVDFGTTTTLAAVGREGHPVELLRLGDEGPRMPSGIFAMADGSLVAGSLAANQAAIAPDSFLGAPKREVGRPSTYLGDRDYTDVELVAAVLGEVLFEAFRQRGARPPDEIILTHPVRWQRAKRSVLRRALTEAAAALPERFRLAELPPELALAAGLLPPPTFMSEPVAAAHHFANSYQLEAGRCLAVYDLGGGTFDVTVVRAGADGAFEILADGGRDDLGGENFDHELLELIGSRHLADDYPDEWAKLRDPPVGEHTWRRHQRELLAQVRRVKEQLSTAMTVPCLVPGIGIDVLVERQDLAMVVTPHLRSTLAELGATLQKADVAPGDLAAVYLVGGSSRIPLVSSMIRDDLKLRPIPLDDPKEVVARGALLGKPKPLEDKKDKEESKEQTKAEEKDKVEDTGVGFDAFPTLTASDNFCPPWPEKPLRAALESFKILAQELSGDERILAFLPEVHHYAGANFQNDMWGWGLAVTDRRLVLLRSPTFLKKTPFTPNTRWPLSDIKVCRWHALGVSTLTGTGIGAQAGGNKKAAGGLRLDLTTAVQLTPKEIRGGAQETVDRPVRLWVGDPHEAQALRLLQVLERVVPDFAGRRDAGALMVAKGGLIGYEGVPGPIEQVVQGLAAGTIGAGVEKGPAPAPTEAFDPGPVDPAAMYAAIDDLAAMTIDELKPTGGPIGPLGGSTFINNKYYLAASRKSFAHLAEQLESGEHMLAFIPIIAWSTKPSGARWSLAASNRGLYLLRGNNMAGTIRGTRLARRWPLSSVIYHELTSLAPAKPGHRGSLQLLMEISGGPTEPTVSYRAEIGPDDEEQARRLSEVFDRRSAQDPTTERPK